MSALAADLQFCEQEYLSFERAAEERHELVDGRLVAMTGCSEEHALICQNLYRALGNALVSSPCRSYASDMKVHIAATGRYRYPDASVSCEPAFLDETRDVLTTPCVIFEVLSRSTEAKDRAEKFDDYRSVQSFGEYVLVRSQMMLVEHYTRQADGTWNLQLLPAGETLRLSCAPVVVPVRELYLKVF